MHGKKLLLGILVLCLLVVIVALSLRAPRPEEEPERSPIPAEESGGFLSELPQIWTTPQDYEEATGNKIGSYKQSPYFDEAVASGQLPPVAERLPEEPLVVLGVEGIGRYGGTYIEAGLEVDGALEQSALPHLMWWKHDFQKPYLNLVKSFEMVDTEGKEYIMKLRKGLKWSDGHPYTADDIVFMIYDVKKYPAFEEAGGTSGSFEFKDIDAEKIDDYTVRWRFGKPKTPMRLVSQFYFAGHYPAHWLKQFHPKYIGMEKAKQMVKDEGFDTLINWFNYHIDRYHQYDLNKPSLDAWVTAQFPSEGHNVGVFKRNPYYFAVDPEGNQLPYMDERHVILTPSEVVAQLRALNGDLSFYQMDVRNYVLAKKAEKEGKMKVYPCTGARINVADIQFNVTHADPAMRALYKDQRFKYGVSHALNRERMNELLFHGLGEPWQVAPYEHDPFYHERLAKLAIEYDPEKANELLDEAGLDKRDANGLRLRPDGKPLVISLLAVEERMDGVAELLLDDLKAVGLNLTYRRVDWAARTELHNANKLDAVLWHDSYGTNAGTFIIWTPNAYLPEFWGCNWAPLWRMWQVDHTKGEKPDPIILEALEHLQKARATLSIEEHKKHWKAILDIAADNLWCIGTLKHPGDIMILAPYMRNVPKTRLSILRGDMGRRDVWWIDK